jgi:hypothetical protein
MAVLNISDDGLLCGASKRLANASTALAIRFQPTWSDVISAYFRLRNQRQSGINDSRSFSLLIVYCEFLAGPTRGSGPSPSRSLSPSSPHGRVRCSRSSKHHTRPLSHSTFIPIVTSLNCLTTQLPSTSALTQLWIQTPYIMKSLKNKGKHASGTALRG